MRRVENPVTLAEAKARLEVFRVIGGYGPHKAAKLARVIWPGTNWRANQGAGAAAGRVLKKLRYKWTSTRNNFGWMI